LESSSAGATGLIAGFPKFASGAAATSAEIATQKENWQAAARLIRDKPRILAKQMEAYDKFPDLFTQATTDASSTNLLPYIILAEQEETVQNQYFTRTGIPDGKDKNEIKAEIEAINNAVSAFVKPTAAIYATGDIKGLTTGSSGQSTSTSTGSLGITYSSARNVYSVRIAVASTQDTLRSGFGAFLLSPANGSPLKSGVVEWFTKIKDDKMSWVHVYVTGASSIWQLERDANKNNVLAKSVSSVGLGALYRGVLINGFVGNTPAGIDFEVGLSSRWVNGDIRALLLDDTGTAQYLKIFPTKNIFLWDRNSGFPSISVK
jgi:hypothetical protein